MSGAGFSSTYSCEHLPIQLHATCTCRTCCFQIPIPFFVSGLHGRNLCCQTFCDTMCSLSCKECLLWGAVSCLGPQGCGIMS